MAFDFNSNRIALQQHHLTQASTRKLLVLTSLVPIGKHLVDAYLQINFVACLSDGCQIKASSTSCSILCPPASSSTFIFQTPNSLALFDSPSSTLRTCQFDGHRLVKRHCASGRSFSRASYPRVSPSSGHESPYLVSYPKSLDGTCRLFRVAVGPVTMPRSFSSHHVSSEFEKR